MIQLVDVEIAPIRDTLIASMPLKCISGSDEIYAFNFSTEEKWNALKNLNAAQRHLRMACCQANVVLRTSKLGTRHFAHARRGPCTTAPETAEHLLAKLEVVNGIRQTEWEAFAEQSGSSPNGESWRADVLAVHKDRKVAFEIQWSQQDEAETRRRQTRYEEAGVRGLWLFRQNDFPQEQEIPSFGLNFDQSSRTFQVLLPPANHETLSSYKELPSASYWRQSIPLTEFVAGALTGKLRFSAAIGMRLPMQVRGVRIRCWKCAHFTNVITSLKIKASRVLPDHPDISASIYDLSNILDELTTFNFPIADKSITRKHGIGKIEAIWSPTFNKKFVSTGCINCEALQGQFFEGKYNFVSRLIFETEITLLSEWIPRLPEIQRQVNFWWFERGTVAEVPDGSNDDASLLPIPMERSN